jgi:hypothetical protein
MPDAIAVRRIGHRTQTIQTRRTERAIGISRITAPRIQVQDFASSSSRIPARLLVETVTRTNPGIDSPFDSDVYPLPG